MNVPLEGPRFPLALELATAIGLALMAGFLFNMSVGNGSGPQRSFARVSACRVEGVNSTVSGSISSTEAA
jgi:hypothetical protein